MELTDRELIIVRHALITYDSHVEIMMDRDPYHDELTGVPEGTTDENLKELRDRTNDLEENIKQIMIDRGIKTDLQDYK